MKVLLLSAPRPTMLCTPEKFGIIVKRKCTFFVPLDLGQSDLTSSARED